MRWSVALLVLTVAGPASGHLACCAAPPDHAEAAPWATGASAMSAANGLEDPDDTAEVAAGAYAVCAEGGGRTATRPVVVR